MRPWESLSRRGGDQPAQRGRDGKGGWPGEESAGPGRRVGWCRGDRSCKARHPPGSFAPTRAGRPAILRVSGSVGFFCRAGPRVRSCRGAARVRSDCPTPLPRPARSNARLGMLPHFRRCDHHDPSPLSAGCNDLLTIIYQSIVRVVHATVGIPVAPNRLSPRSGRVSRRSPETIHGRTISP
jgi:hypothetical protein